MRKAFLLGIFLILSIPFPGISQELKDLEAVSRSGDVLFFDYRLHRNPAYIYRHLLVGDSLNSFNLHHLYRGQSIYSTGPKVHHLKPTGHYKLDLQFKPFFSARFGDREDPFRTQVGIGPRLQLNSKKGFYGIFQWLIPLQNDFHLEFGLGPRPGEIGLGYSHIVDQQSFINFFTGVLNNNRYGVYGEFIRMNTQGTIYYGAASYYTGSYIFVENTFIRQRIDYFSGYIFFAYRFISSDVTMRLTAERFLHDDFGVSFEIIRQFGNTDIGFFGKKSKLGENAGLFIAVSLWPRKFYNNKWLQVRLPNSFGFRYDLRAAMQGGRQVRPQTNFFYDILRFNPNFINKQLEVSRTAK